MISVVPILLDCISTKLNIIPQTGSIRESASKHTLMVAIFSNVLKVMQIKILSHFAKTSCHLLQKQLETSLCQFDLHFFKQRELLHIAFEGVM